MKKKLGYILAIPVLFSVLGLQGGLPRRLVSRVITITIEWGAPSRATLSSSYATEPISQPFAGTLRLLPLQVRILRAFTERREAGGLFRLRARRVCNEQPAVNQVCTHLGSGRASCVRAVGCRRQGGHRERRTAELEPEQQQQQQRQHIAKPQRKQEQSQHGSHRRTDRHGEFELAGSRLPHGCCHGRPDGGRTR